MNDAEIRKYANLMRELGLTGLEITENDRVVRLERAPAPAAPVRETVAVPAAPAAPAPAAPAAAAEGVEITSPMVGVFYAAPAENAEPFVKVGDRVRRGQTLCIVEAMKLMNEIMAEMDGEIVEVCAENGQVVDYGCPLFRIKGQ
ncbi:MAG: acetyl-CoA carboxylase biotin carboxyl carrier protein [Clostridiales bacterium]|nr:acetyl-CoA carboxylase biotin carboxyl carrier protein [Clostridiales bacterium]